jgi:hypothetical protein
MLYRAAADLVVLVHLAFVAFVVLGGLLVLRRPWVAWIHLPAALWGALIEFGGWICPLTPLEVALRQSAGEAGYSGGFIEHYVVALLYPEALTRELQIAFGALVVLVNACLYFALARRMARGRGS